MHELTKLWGKGARWELEESEQPHEAQSLKLDWSKAAARLRWRPELRLKDALAMTVAWYRAKLQGQDMHVFTSAQIEKYEKTRQTDTRVKAKRSGVHA